MSDNLDWIVTTQMHKLVCKRCGMSYQIQLPQPTWAYVALSDGFVAQHKDCKEDMVEDC